MYRVYNNTGMISLHKYAKQPAFDWKISYAFGFVGCSSFKPLESRS